MNASSFSVLLSAITSVANLINFLISFASTFNSSRAYCLALPIVLLSNPVSYYFARYSMILAYQSKKSTATYTVPVFGFGGI